MAPARRGAIEIVLGRAAGGCGMGAHIASTPAAAAAAEGDCWAGEASSLAASPGAASEGATARTMRKVCDCDADLGTACTVT